MIARDHEGRLAEAASSCRKGCIDHPELAEAIGIKEALSWVKAKDWRRVILETDCLVVTQAIRSAVARQSISHTLIE